MNSEETVPEWAFAGVPHLRHVSVESALKSPGGEIWQQPEIPQLISQQKKTLP